MNSSKFTISSPGLWLGILIMLSIGCRSYYIPVTADTSTPQAAGNIVTSNVSQKLLILRQGADSYGLKNPVVDTAALTLNATLVVLDSSLFQYINAKPREYSYRNSVVLKEVHIFSKDSSKADLTNAFTLPLDKIEKIEVIEKDKRRTQTSRIIGGVITFVILYPIVGMVILAAELSNL